MGVHYTYIGEIIQSPEMQKYVSGALLGGVMVVGGAVLTKRLATAGQVEEKIVPAKAITSLGFVDFIIESYVRYHDSILGKEHRKHIPFTATIFFFILISNLLGLIPGMAAITTTVRINVAIALCSFIYFNYVGIRENGFLGYMKHFSGPLQGAWWFTLFPVFMFILEWFSTCLRVLTLNLRLYWNMSADHMVLGIFTEQFGLLGIPFYALGIFVSFMQAFVFTTLTIIYILLAVQHDDEGH